MTYDEKHLDILKIQNRLKRIEGQIRGVSAMLSEQRRCEDILTQLSAINSAVTGTAREILYSHIEHTVAELDHSNVDETVLELKSVIEVFGKLK